MFDSMIMTIISPENRPKDALQMDDKERFNGLSFLKL